MQIRIVAALVLAALLGTTALAQNAAKENAKDKESDQAIEPKWPDKIYEKNVHEWLKVIETEKDPALREQALKVLWNFSPSEVRKLGAKLLLRRMISGGEPDNGVRIAVIDLVGALGMDEPADITEATRILSLSANNGASALRLHAIQALGRFGPKAYHHINDLTSDVVMSDSAFEIRQALAQTLGRIGASESGGPNTKALNALTILATKDQCAVVRMEALQSLLLLGPPWSANLKPGSKDPPEYDPKRAQDMVEVMKARLAPKKGSVATETDKHMELWYRFVIIRFGVKDDLEEQMTAIAHHLTDPEASVRIQALEILGRLGDLAAPKLEAIMKLLSDKELAVRATALMALGGIGEKAMETLKGIIRDPKEETEIRVAALAGLAKMGEKAENARELVMSIIEDPMIIQEATASSIALLDQALFTLAAMGVKAQSAIPLLQNLIVRLDDVKKKRLETVEYKKFVNNPEFKKMLDKLSPEEKEKLFDNHPEDQLKRFVKQAIHYIEDSTPGHPGGETKPEHKKAK
jgi:HEAT repeat protein